MGRRGVLDLFRRSDFRRVYLAVTASELGDAFQYVALMWFALVSGGPLGVLAVRLADSVPALAFGFHGGLVADRLDRRRTMIAADLFRGALLVPVAALGLSGELPLWLLVVAAFALTAAASYFDPAYGALLPELVERENVQRANGLVRATADALSVGGWAAAAGLLAFMPISAFFAVNAASFFVSAALLFRVAHRGGIAFHSAAPRIREGFAALRPRPVLAAAVVVLGVAVTISAGTWIVGVPTLVRDQLERGAGSFSLMAAAYAIGSVAAGIFLSRVEVRRKALGSMLAWCFYLPAYGLFAFAGSFGLVLVGAALCGVGQGTAYVLVTSAAQEEVPDGLLGRVMGLISLTHRGAHATGLLFVSPLFAILAPGTVFAAAAIALPLVGIAGAAVSARAGGARGLAPARIPRS
jgi:MFS transporter, DHA3 family, macrolide efflux protein